MSTRKRDALVLSGVVGMVLLIGVVYARWLGGTQWDADEGIMLMQARLLGQGFQLYSQITSDQPPGVPLSILAAFRLVGDSVEVGRLTTLVYALVGLLGVALLAVLLSRAARAWPVAAFAAPLLLALTPNFFWLARSVVRDIPALSMATLAVALALLYARTRRQRWLILAAAVFTWAVCLKLSVGLLAAPLLAFAYWPVLDSASSRWRVAVRTTLALAVGSLPLVLLFGGLFDVVGFYDQAITTPLAARTVWPNRAAEYSQWVAGYLVIDNRLLTALAGVGLAALLRRRRRWGVIMAGWLALTVLALVNQRPLFAEHHFAMLLYPLAALAGIGAAVTVAAVTDAWRDHHRWPLAGAGVAVLVLLIGLSRVPDQVSSLRANLRPAASSSLLEAAVWLARNTQPSDFVVTDPPMIAFRAQRLQTPGLVVPSSKIIETDVLSAQQAIEDAEAFQPKALALWNGRLNRLDAFMAWVKQHYVEVENTKGRTLWLAFDPASIQHPQSGRFGNVAELLGYNLADEDREVTLTLYWRALAAPSQDWTVFTHVVGPNGQGYGQHDGTPAEGAEPTSGWDEGQVIRDEHVIVMTAAAPVTTSLEVGFYDRVTGARLPVTVDGERVDGDQLTLNTLLAPVMR